LKYIQSSQKLSILFLQVNNAGMSKKGSIETCEISDFDEQLAVNLRAPFILTQLCVPHLIASKGNIVNVSSTVTDTHLQNGLAYGISKAGIDKLTKCCANELGLKGNSSAFCD
jgi:NAD(P)-dependent dehydrogenase (short-subunit alcohol dehydrogenase family)